MLSTGRFFALAVLAPLLITLGCQQSAIRPCPYHGETTERANAGCLITRGDEVLIVTLRKTGKQSLPGGTSEPGESPRCTAYRETLEETGLKVSVNEHLATFENGFQLFRCELKSDQQPLNILDQGEISAIDWRTWLSLDQDNWRYPSMYPQTRTLIHNNITGISKELE